MHIDKGGAMLGSGDGGRWAVVLLQWIVTFAPIIQIIRIAPTLSVRLGGMTRWWRGSAP